MTQELIANMLGVRREGVTEAAGKLQDAGLIVYRRGQHHRARPPGSRARSCECYQVVKAEYDRLLSELSDIPRGDSFLVVRRPRGESTQTWTVPSAGC